MFHKICEAYDVLSHPERKALFDKYGEYGLKNGVTNHNGQSIKNYIYGGNSNEIYDKFMEIAHFNDNSYDLDGCDLYGSILGTASKGKG